MASGESGSQDLFARAKTALSFDASDKTRAQVAETLESLAASLLLEWLVGDKRFESQSQQTEYWLSRFYDELYVDEQPDPTRIYERFQIPLPRASYLARLLRARRAAQWRRSARVELKTQLHRAKARAEVEVKEGRGQITDFDVSLSSGATDELRVLYDRIAAVLTGRERPKPPKVKPAFGSTQWLGVPAATLLMLIAKIDEDEKE